MNGTKLEEQYKYFEEDRIEELYNLYTAKEFKFYAVESGRDLILIQRLLEFNLLKNGDKKKEFEIVPRRIAHYLNSRMNGFVNNIKKIANFTMINNQLDWSKFVNECGGLKYDNDDGLFVVADSYTEDDVNLEKLKMLKKNKGYITAEDGEMLSELEKGESIKQDLSGYRNNRFNCGEKLLN